MEFKNKLQFGLYRILLVLMLAFLLQLRLPALLFCMAFVLLLCPVWIKSRMEAIRQEHRLEEAALYMEQLLYAFLANPKILSALEELEKLFDAGEMKTVIGQAVDSIRHDYDSDTTEALQLIEQAYPNDRIKSIHAYLRNVEQHGGEYEMTIELLLEDLRKWLERIRIYQEDCRKYKRNVWVAAALSFLVCAITNVLLPSELAISQHVVCQGASVLFICTDIWLCRRAERRTSRNWLEAGAYQGTDNREQQYEYVKKHKNMKAFFYRKELRKNIERVFPQWLMELSLLLQTENVQVAFYKTREHAPAVLKPAITELLEELQRNPESMQPYLDFLKEYHLRDVTATMRMLYALSNSGYGNGEKQLAQIMMRNQELLDKTERAVNEDALAGLYALFLAPALTGAGKMMVDMTMFLVAFLAQTKI